MAVDSNVAVISGGNYSLNRRQHGLLRDPLEGALYGVIGVISLARYGARSLITVGTASGREHCIPSWFRRNSFFCDRPVRGLCGATYSGLIGLRMLEVPCLFWESDLSIPRRYLRGVEPRPLEKFVF